MAFSFKRKESVAAGVRRLCRELSNESIRLLKVNCNARSVHSVRKDLKRIRAVLRLAGQSIPRKTLRRQMGLLRDAAGRVAPVREARVAVDSLKAVRGQSSRKRVAPTFPRIARGLGRRLRDAMREFEEKKSARKTGKRLRRFMRNLDDCHFRRKGWNAIGPGVAAGYRKAQAGYQRARENPTPAALHEWRKRVKDVWYCLQLLRASCPAKIDALADGFNGLGECLGHDHDFWMLRRTARRLAKTDHSELSALAELVERRRRELQQTAFALGARLFTQTPADFHKKLAQHWKAWRRGEPHPRSR